ncbi:MAG: ureidoglycolate lyase [Sandaracinaceae bacterium]
MLELTALPIDADAYGAFGRVIQAGESPARACNHGTAAAWDGLAEITSLRPNASVGTSLFRCTGLETDTLSVRWLERHVHSTQLFAPLAGGRYLLVVARGGDAPDLSTLKAFVVEGATAITYHPGVWHHPMVALDRSIDFLNVLATDGTDADCDEVTFDPPCARVHQLSR